MKIKNFNELAKNELRKKLLEIVNSGLEAIDTKTAIKRGVQLVGERKIKIYDKEFKLEGKLWVVGVGKCSLEAAWALEEVLGNKIDGGIVLDVRQDIPLRRIISYKGSHPFPTEENILSARHIIEFLSSNAKDDDLVIMIISGGGSTLLCQPKDLTCQQESEILRCLTEKGASIQEINTLRKHISLARGGNLAKYAYPARVAALIFSDVPGDDLEFIASGPTVYDTTTVDDAWEVVKKYQADKNCGINKENLIETPKDRKYLENVENILFVSNQTALEAMSKEAKAKGFEPHICSFCLAGEARVVGESIIREINNAPPNTALLYGGETTVNIKGKGRGGRNQELVLSAVKFLSAGVIIASVASDGRDNTDYAGAVGDLLTRQKAQQLNLNIDEFLSNNDSYNFFHQVGDYILTGTTGSNVSDLVIAMKGAV